jgi:hypothetical protein
MLTAESSADACPLDERQQRRILDGVLAGPVVELLGELERRLPSNTRRRDTEEDRQRATLRQLRPMQHDIPLHDDSGRAGLPWPGSALTGDDQRRLATMGNTTRLSNTALLHHSVCITHHLFQMIVLEIMATNERTGVAVRDLLMAISNDGTHPVSDAEPPPHGAANREPDAGHAGLDASVSLVSPTTNDDVEVSSDDHRPIAAEAADEPCTTPSIPPFPMAKRTAAPSPREAVTDERIEQLEARMLRLQETMDVLIDSIDEFRDDLVHALRNTPDRLPPALHLHSLPLDATDPNFAEGVNAIPPDVMQQLRDEAVRNSGQPSTVAVAAETTPASAPLTDDPPGNGDHRRYARQPRLFR